MDTNGNELHEWDPGEVGAREDVDRAFSALRKRFGLSPPPPLGDVDLDAPLSSNEFWAICQAVFRPHGPADALDGAWHLTIQTPNRTDDFERHLTEALRAVAPDALDTAEAAGPSTGDPVDWNTLIRACSAVLRGPDTWRAVADAPARLAEVPITPGATALLRVADMARQIRALRIANTLLPAELIPWWDTPINHVELLQQGSTPGALKLSPYADDDIVVRRSDGSEVSRDGWTI